MSSVEVGRTAPMRCRAGEVAWVSGVRAL